MQRTFSVSIWVIVKHNQSSNGLKGQLRWSNHPHFCVQDCLKTSQELFMYCRPRSSCFHAQHMVLCWDVSIGVSRFFAPASGLTGVIQEVAVWLSAACPHFENFEAPEAWAPFSPTAAPELCLTLHTKWRLCVTNWFQLAVAMVSTLEGAVGGRRGQEG